MESLPDEILELIVGSLPARALCSLACTSRRNKRVCDSRAGLTLTCTSRNRADLWALQNPLRVVCLKYMRAYPPLSLADFSRLRTLTVQFSMIPSTSLDSLPDTLEHITIHRVHATQSTPAQDASVNRLLTFPKLKTLDITFLASHMLLTVTASLTASCPLERLSIRGCAIIVASRLPPSLKSLALEASTMVSVPTPLPPSLESLSVSSRFWGIWGGVEWENWETTLPTTLRRLWLRAPWSVIWTVPSLASCSALEDVFLEARGLILTSECVDAICNATTAIVQTKSLPVVIDTRPGLTRVEEDMRILRGVRWVIVPGASEAQ